MTTQSTGDGMKKATAFFAGFSAYQLPHITFSASRYTLMRFQVSPKHVGLYINRMIIAFRLFTLITIAFVTIWDQCQWPAMMEVGKGTVVLLGASYGLILTVYCIGGEQGYLTFYYWTICFASLTLGAAFVFLVKIISKEIAYFMAALPIVGIQVSLYHLLFLVLTNYIQVNDICFWIVFWQIVIAIAFSILTIFMIFFAYSGSTDSQNNGAGSNESFWKAFGDALSPILLITLGYGIHNAFYPAIAPYKFTNIRTGYNIDLVVLFTTAVPPLVILFLKEKQMGPNVPWNGDKWWWNLGWLFFLAEVTCALIFLWGLHYPQWPTSQVLRGDTVILGVLTIFYDFCAQCTRTLGTNGASMQSGKDNSKMDTLNTLAYSVVQVLFAFIGDGYLRTYSASEKDIDNWPTKHYGRLRSFWFWCWTAAKVSLGNIGTAFTTNVRGAIQTKKDYLFIIYADG